MMSKLCMQTPAGEHYSGVVETAELEEHVLLSALRAGVHDALAWVDDHIDWSSGKAVMKSPIKGEGDWQIRLHPQARTCPLCETRAPAAKAPAKPQLVQKR